MKNFPLIICLLKYIITLKNHHSLQKIGKCFDNYQKISLQNSPIISNEFTITIWARAVHNKDIFNSKPFFKFENISNNNSIFINFDKNNPNSNFFEFYFKNLNLGNFFFSDDTLNIQNKDLLNFENRYTNWNFFGISFEKIDSLKIHFVINNNYSNKNILNDHKITDLLFHYCLFNENNLQNNNLYFGDILIFDEKTISLNDFNILKNYPISITAVYLFTENARKNRFFIPNSIKNDFGALEVLTNPLMYPFEQSRLIYSIAIFKKLFRFKIDNISIINNSYVIQSKIRIKRYNGTNYKFLFYGRASKELDIYNNDPDILEISLNFENSDSILKGNVDYVIKIILNNNILNNLRNNFTETVDLILALEVKYEIIPFSEIKKKIKFVYSHYTNFDSWERDNLDFSNFKYDDQHFFGLPQTNKEEIIFFYITEYNIFRGNLNIGENYFEAAEYYLYSYKFNQRRYEEDNTSDIIKNSDLNPFTDYCSKGCLKCKDIKCTSCFNRFNLNQNDRCESECSLNDAYDSLFSKCYSSTENISLNFINNKIDTLILRKINKDIFDKTNEKDFIIFIRLKIGIELNYQPEFELSYSTQQEDVNISNFITFFDYLPTNFNFVWTLSYIEKPEIEVLLNELEVYGECLEPLEYFYFDQIKNKGTCVLDCPNGYFINQNKICQKCFSNCSECIENSCIICDHNYTLHNGICLITFFQCSINIPNCKFCDELDENKCKICLDNFFLSTNGDCYSNDTTDCITVVNNCFECDEVDKFICKNCINNYSLKNSECLNNTHCLISIEQCIECNNTDNKFCKKCNTGFTLYNGICLSKTNCLFSINKCIECDNIDETICTKCDAFFSLNNGICLSNTNCLISVSNCIKCDISNETICTDCINNYEIYNNNCLYLTNCLISIQNCSQCSSIDSTQCINCINKYQIHNGNCLLAGNCLLSVPNCIECNQIDLKKCLNCKENYGLYQNLCYENENLCKVYDKNCLICDYKNPKECLTCKENFIYDFFLFKCVEKICNENCLDCFYDINNDHFCTKCDNVYILDNSKCVKEICFGNFCNDCSFQLNFGCEICYDCLNLNFLEGIVVNCELTFLKCKFCYVKFNEISKCLIFDNDSFLEFNKCLAIEEKSKDNFVFNLINDDFINTKCGKEYLFNGKKCEKISFNCELGCIICWEENKKCVECNNQFILYKEKCLLKTIKNPIDINSKNFKDILPYFYYENLECHNIINNITLAIQNNITTYLNQKDFIHDKTYEIKEFFINCSQNKTECENINKLKLDKKINKNISDEKICNEIYETTHKTLIKLNNNITINKNFDFCEKPKNITKIEEKFICENKECLKTKRLKEITKSINITDCNNYYKNSNNFLENEEKKKEKNKNECEYCQKKLDYFCPWEKDCKKNCEIILIDNNIIKNNDIKSKIHLSEDLINKSLPKYIKANFNYVQQKLSFKFQKNIKSYNFLLKIKYLKNAKNCILKNEEIYIIKNKSYFHTMVFVDDFLGIKNVGKSGIFTIFNFATFSIVPSYFYDLLQFNDLFTYFDYLNINGGVFYNYITNMVKNHEDIDFYLINKKKLYEYQMILPITKRLKNCSIIDFYFIFGILFVLLSKFFLKNSFYFRINQSLKLLKKLKRLKKNYHKFNFIKKGFYYFLYLYLCFDFKKIIFYYERIIVSQYIFIIPQYMVLISLKINLIEKKYLIIYFFIFF